MLDPVPRLLTAQEWAELQIGIAQRLNALDAFVTDVHGDARALAAGVLPREAVEGSPHHEPSIGGAPLRVGASDRLRRHPRAAPRGPAPVRAPARRRASYVLPGGNSRFAVEAGSMLVNSALGGGAKDTWILG